MNLISSIKDYPDLRYDYPLYQGKVRDTLDLGDRLLLLTTDRVSAFDRVLGLIPYKGEILNRLTCWWLDQTKELVPNHFIQQVGSRAMVCQKARVIPVEVVVRAYLTGSAWRDYQAGNPISGIQLAPGMKKNQRFDQPIITPSTKAEQGLHDEPISVQSILDRQLVSPEVWTTIETYALRLFARGTEVAKERGLILVDTKYEFGLVDQPGSDKPQVILVDEIHTPDSSRYWYAQGYEERFQAGQDPKSLDKEFLRAWLMDRGFSGSGDPPPITPELADQISKRYQELYQILTGETFSTIFTNLESETHSIAVIL